MFENKTRGRRRMNQVPVIYVYDNGEIFKNFTGEENHGASWDEADVVDKN